MENKSLNEYTDLELAEISGQVYQQLMSVQQNLIAINGEIQNRKSDIKPKKEK